MSDKKAAWGSLVRFDWFDPYVSVMTAKKPAFRTADGKAVKTYRNAKPLLYLAHQAARELTDGNAISLPTWEALLRGARAIFEEARENIQIERIDLRDPFNQPIKPPPLNLWRIFDVASVLQQLLLRELDSAPEEFRNLMRELWCIICLHEIDGALLACMYEDAGSGISNTIAATQALANAKAIRDMRPLPFKSMGLKGALAKLKNDPKQHDKRQVKDCWDAWQAEPLRYATKAAFARDMRQKFESLDSQAVIERWCREWERTQAAQ